MLITIVVPIYKVEAYLEECLKSIISQTYRELQILLIPQPGGDECERICREYEKKDGRITVIPQSVCDLSHARNIGIENAKGEYIAFIDSDDFIDVHFVEKLYGLLIKHGADIVQCRSYAFMDAGNVVYKIDEEYEDVYSGRQMCEALLRNKYGSDTGVIQTKLYKISLFDAINFPEGKVNEDGATNYKLYWAADKAVVTGYKLYYYRSQRKGSIIHTISDRLLRDSVRFSIERVQFFYGLGEQKLYELAAYILVNDITRARLAVREDLSYIDSLKRQQKELLPVVTKSRNISCMKRFLVRIAYISPEAWKFFWMCRNKLRKFVEWNVKGVRK